MFVLPPQGRLKVHDATVNCGNSLPDAIAVTLTLCPSFNSRLQMFFQFRGDGVKSAQQVVFVRKVADIQERVFRACSFL